MVARAQRADVGLVYRRRGRLHLALAPERLVTVVGGELRSSRPRAEDAVVSDVSVEALCAAWRVDVATLDRLSDEGLPRPEAPLRSRPRGSTPGRAAREHAWRLHRTHRLQRAS